MIFLKFFSPNVHVREFFSLPYFSCPFCRFSIFVFVAFSFVFSTLSRKWRRTLFVLELRHLFFRYSVHLVKEIVKLLKKSERWENKWSKVKTLHKTNQGVDGRVFFTNCVKNVIEKAVSICVIIQQDCKVKRKLQLHNIKVSSTTVWRYVTNKGWKALKRSEKGGPHFMQAWHQKNLQTLYHRTTGRQTHVMWTL